jgi:hypothetical protein
MRLQQLLSILVQVEVLLQVTQLPLLMHLEIRFPHQNLVPSMRLLRRV